MALWTLVGQDPECAQSSMFCGTLSKQGASKSEHGPYPVFAPGTASIQHIFQLE